MFAASKNTKFKEKNGSNFWTKNWTTYNTAVNKLKRNPNFLTEVQNVNKNKTIIYYKIKIYCLNCKQEQKYLIEASTEIHFFFDFGLPILGNYVLESICMRYYKR